MTKPPIRCVFLEPSTRCEESLRRFTMGADKCPATGGHHKAEAAIGRRRARASDASRVEQGGGDDARWPTHCACGYAFTAGDAWQRNTHRLYRPSDGGALVTLRDAPTGAMWWATWLEGNAAYTGRDGRALTVRCPGRHDWLVDARASNCDSPCTRCGKPYHAHAGGLCNPKDGYPEDGSNHYSDTRPLHKCWCRHGEPPDVHVDKVGETCGAGAGSIAYPGWHGFLHHGALVEC